MASTNFLFCIILMCVIASDADSVKIKTPLGRVKGHFKSLENGRKYAAFEGIPYALPPLGDLRFEPPQRTGAWKGELSATKLGDQCLQYIHKFDSLSGFLVKSSEDCLYLNVYVPDRRSNASLPVLLWIHGGAFTFGMPNVFSENYVMAKNVIFVTVNYRLGPLGFLSTEDDVVPGNMGLKDQSMALLWIHENIKYFGGNPDRITLVGLGAGGASVHYHYFSPLSAGLFQNGISMSGTALNYWANRRNVLERTRKLGQLVGCSAMSSNRVLVNCMKKAKAEDIVAAVKEFSPYLYKPFYPFGPVAESTNDSPFIDAPPEVKLQNGQVQDIPWITGITSREGIYAAVEFINKDHIFRDSKTPHDMLMSLDLLDIDDASHMKEIKEHYDIKGNCLTVECRRNVIKAIGDRLYAVEAQKAARMQARVNKSPVWFYVYNYMAYESLNTLFNSVKYFEGVSHGDDLSLLLKLPYLQSANAKKDQAMRKDLLKLWISFAEKGSSIQDFYENWQEIHPAHGEFEYLKINGSGSFDMVGERDFGNQNFWKKFYVDLSDTSDATDDQKDEL